MVRLIEEKVEGYADFKSRITEIENLTTKSQVFVLFTGSKQDDGSSWCPDCNDFENIFEKLRSKVEELVPDHTIFLRVLVGNRDAWKSKNPLSPFRTDVKLKLTSIPTLIDWNTPSKRLSDNQILNTDNLLMLFEE